MNRRFFITITTATIPSFAWFSFFDKDDEWKIIKGVQEHFFPKSRRFAGADEFGATAYLKFVSKDDSFKRDDLDFLLHGAKKLSLNGFKNSLSYTEKEEILRDFEKSNFGENWLSLLLTYSLEALFSDPIYGGNSKGIGWKNFNHNTGEPRPKVHFGVLS